MRPSAALDSEKASSSSASFLKIPVLTVFLIASSILAISFVAQLAVIDDLLGLGGLLVAQLASQLLPVGQLVLQVEDVALKLFQGLDWTLWHDVLRLGGRQRGALQLGALKLGLLQLRAL